MEKEKLPYCQFEHYGKPYSSVLFTSDKIILRGNFKVKIMNHRYFSNLKQNNINEKVSSLLWTRTFEHIEHRKVS